MAKDGTNRGGRRVKAGSKPDALADKITRGAPARRMELPDFTDDLTDLDTEDIGDGVELEGMDKTPENEYSGRLSRRALSLVLIPRIACRTRRLAVFYFARRRLSCQCEN